MKFLDLNESNIQRGFLYNRVDNSYNYKTVEGSFVVGGLNTALAQGSDVYACDIGYTVEGDSSNWQFLIGGSLADKLIIKTISSAEELSLLDFDSNICAIVVDDVYLSNIVFLSNKYAGKTISFKVTTLNSTLSSFMMDNIAFKLNNFDVDEYIALKQAFNKEIQDREDADNNILSVIDEKVEELKNQLTDVDTTITNQDNKIASNKSELEGVINDETTAREEAIIEVNEKIDSLNTVAEELVNQEKTDREAAVKVVDDKLTDEIKNRADKDTELENEIQTLSGRLDGEIADRQSKDTELEAKIGEKIIRGEFKTSAVQGNFSDIEYLEYDNNYKELTATYTETNTSSIDSLSAYTTAVVLPIITDVKFIDIKANKDLLVYYSDSKIHYVNVSGEAVEVNGLKLNFYIRGK